MAQADEETTSSVRSGTDTGSVADLLIGLDLDFLAWNFLWNCSARLPRRFRTWRDNIMVLAAMRERFFDGFILARQVLIVFGRVLPLGRTQLCEWSTGKTIMAGI